MHGSRQAAVIHEDIWSITESSICKELARHEPIHIAGIVLKVLDCLVTLVKVWEKPSRVAQARFYIQAYEASTSLAASSSFNLSSKAGTCRRLTSKSSFSSSSFSLLSASNAVKM